MDTECSICSLSFDDTVCRLACNHTFHYECIYQWYKRTLDAINIPKRECPYCRQDGGYLHLPDNNKFEEGIHDHSSHKQNKQISRCKRTTLKGTKCKKNATSDTGFCHIHQ